MKTIKEIVDEFEKWMDKESEETSGEIGQSDLSDRFEEALTSHTESIIKELEELKSVKHTWRTNELLYPTQQERDAHNKAIEASIQALKSSL